MDMSTDISFRHKDYFDIKEEVFVINTRTSFFLVVPFYHRHKNYQE